MTVGLNLRPHTNRLASLGVLIGAALLAVASARLVPGSWNDASRLATVECLVDHRTLAIDQSCFLDKTKDRLFIRGHYYSDKSPVPALLMAGLYQGLQAATGLSARGDPDSFCYWMTLGTSGLAYAIAVWCVFELGIPLGLSLFLRLILSGSFALSTVALTYAQHVNNHELLLGVAAATMLLLAKLATGSAGGGLPWRSFVALGALGGLAYSIDLGSGPVFLMCLVGALAYRFRSVRPVAVCLASAVPFLIAHHAVNYAVGGTFKPANAVAEYFDWPGCPFNTQNMTGKWQHSGVGHLATYSLALLAGKRGFLGHNLPLLLAVPAVVFLLRRRPAEWPELLFALFWCGGTWAAYAITSNNYSGMCCSIRWLVPLLAPGYFVLALFLRDHPSFQWDFLILSGWGAFLAGLMWDKGPWMQHMVPLFWPIQGAALLCWIVLRVRFQRQSRPDRLTLGAVPKRSARAA